MSFWLPSKSPPSIVVDEEDNDLMSSSQPLSHLRPAVLYDHVPTEESIQFQKEYDNKKREQRLRNDKFRRSKASHQIRRDNVIETNRNRHDETTEGDDDQQKSDDNSSDDDIETADETEGNTKSQHEEESSPTSSTVGYYVSYMICQVSAPPSFSAVSNALGRRTNTTQNTETQNNELPPSQQTTHQQLDQPAQLPLHDQSTNEGGGNLSYSWMARGDDGKMETILETDDDDYVFVAPPITSTTRTRTSTVATRETFNSRRQPSSSLSMATISASSAVTLVQATATRYVIPMIRLCWNAVIRHHSSSSYSQQRMIQTRDDIMYNPYQYNNELSPTAQSTTVFDVNGNGLILPGSVVDMNGASQKNTTTTRQSVQFHPSYHDDDEKDSLKITDLSSCLIEDEMSSSRIHHNEDSNQMSMVRNTTEEGTLIVPPREGRSTWFSRPASLWSTLNSTSGETINTTDTSVQSPPTSATTNAQGTYSQNLSQLISPQWFWGRNNGTKTVMISAADLLAIEQQERERKKRRGDVQDANDMAGSHDQYVFRLEEEHSLSDNGVFEESMYVDNPPTSASHITRARPLSTLSPLEQWIQALWYYTYRQFYWQKMMLRRRVPFLNAAFPSGWDGDMGHHINCRHLSDIENLFDRISSEVIKYSTSLISDVYFSRQLTLEHGGYNAGVCTEEDGIQTIGPSVLEEAEIESSENNGDDDSELDESSEEYVKNDTDRKHRTEIELSAINQYTGCYLVPHTSAKMLEK